jgi:Uma2 family endonuclease
MQLLEEIVLHETKPESEWIAGREVPKAMPTREHGILQLAFGEALRAWAKAGKRGDVATEWRFRVTLPDERIHPLIPDVAYMSYARLRLVPKPERRYPPIAPEIVIEILSPTDKPTDVEYKRKEYLAWGVSLVLIVDPATRSMESYDSTGVQVTVPGAVELYCPLIFPDLPLPMRALFAELDDPADF